MHDHTQHQPGHEGQKPFWKTPLGWAFIGFAAIAAFFLLTEHGAHVFGVLPYLLILACPLMHMFMHRHGGHGGHGQDKKDERETPAGKGGTSAHQH
jgi:hypothetical protein